LERKLKLLKPLSDVIQSATGVDGPQYAVLSEFGQKLKQSGRNCRLLIVSDQCPIKIRTE
jgi:hypothetical protein